jgi:hypothetical protein
MADTDFYTRREDQSMYVNDILEVDDEISLLIEQIENVLFTRKTQVIGQKNFGLNLEELLFSLRRNEAELKTTMLQQIYDYCPLAAKYKVDVAVIFQKAATRDVAYIDIYINDRRTFGVIM